ncbi:MAG: peptidoglycan editing factor PgeF [Rickettsiaceae bacterium]
MLDELIKNKVYYKIFDRSNYNLTHNYNIHNFADQLMVDQAKNNIDRVIQSFDAKNMLLLKQVHGNNVVYTDGLNDDFNIWPEADASVTKKIDTILAIRTADCVPVLLASEDGAIIGVAHSGWRGAKLDIIEKVANTMKQKGASDIVAVIAPSITQKSYEVSKDFYEDFIQESSIYQNLFLPSIKPNFYMFDLQSFVKIKLAKENIKIIKHITDDTYTMADKYPSYRRSTHTGEIYNQTILSSIIIK